jgi:D-alanyl-lipoteichoic acid acyltransferase DltB (MBOAT superfamily)
MAFIPRYILILFLIIVIDYFSGIAIEGSTGRVRKTWLLASLLSNILLLCFFKYFNFFNENVQTVFSLFGKEFQPVNLSIILPIGLSFHTFQSMSYTIEVYRGKQKAERHLGYFANYVLFFPQMVAGPIERYEHLGEQLKQEQKPRYESFARGFRLLLFGLFVKMTVADNIAPIVNDVYKSPLVYNAYEVWAAVFLFSFQIYADFYGYSTIAVGCAHMLGISIMDNFKTPYLSKNVTEFWSRWHISLSTWFRDYLYISLGGNRVSLLRWSFNIMVVFMVSGLWHGASWTFVVWGALHGLMLLCERYFARIFKDLTRSASIIIHTLLVIKTFIITSVIWIFFRAKDFHNAKEMIYAMLKNFDTPVKGLDVRAAFVFTLLLVVTDLLLYNSRFDHKVGSWKFGFRWLAYSVLIFSLFALSGTQKFVFIYFQF